MVRYSLLHEISKGSIGKSTHTLFGVTYFMIMHFLIQYLRKCIIIEKKYFQWGGGRKSAENQVHTFRHQYTNRLKLAEKRMNESLIGCALALASCNL